MAARRYHISTPEQLKDMRALVKDGNLTPLASVWSVMVRKVGKAPWDNAIYAYFSGDRDKEATVIRYGVNNETVRCARLKYNMALEWCEAHLKRTE